MEHSLIKLLVLVVVLGIVWWLIDLASLPNPFNKIAKIILVVVLIVMLLRFAGLF